MVNDDCQLASHHVRRLIPIFLLFLIPTTQSALYPFGLGNGDKKIEWPKWELGSEQIDLDTSVPLLGGGKLSNVWVNTVGSLTYRQLMDARIENLVNNVALAPYFIQSKEGAIGAVHYRQTRTDSLLLQLIADDVYASLILPPSDEDIVTLDFKPTYALIVTWSNVASVQDSTMLNTFQIVITTDGSRSFAIFNYDDTLSWSSSTNGRHAAAGIFVAPNVESSCVYELQHSQTDEVTSLAQGMNTGEVGRFVLIISEPLPCLSGFQTPCEEILPFSDWGFAEPYFSISGDSWDVYALHTCNPGFSMKPNVTRERIDCLYEPDYYSSTWERDPAKCLDLKATKIFDIIVEVAKIGNDSSWIHEPTDPGKMMEDLQKFIEISMTKILNLTDVIVTVTNITRETRRPETRSERQDSVSVGVKVHIPPYIHKKITADNITSIITNTLEETDEVGGITYLPTVEVQDNTDKCLQGCICRFKKEPKFCPRGKIPQIQPDSCCGGCNGKPYSSTIKACCNNEHIYDPSKARCCNGRVRRGATGKCPKL